MEKPKATVLEAEVHVGFENGKWHAQVRTGVGKWKVIGARKTKEGTLAMVKTWCRKFTEQKEAEAGSGVALVTTVTWW